MSATQRASLINKLHKVCKKLYEPVIPPSNRTVLEHMMFACCLDNSAYEAADEAYAKLQDHFFDWNEIRVTTAAELAEVMKCLPSPSDSALLLKRTLHGVFETYYNFELDFLKKENLRKTVQQMEEFQGVSPFVTSYVAQVALGGHYIPLDKAMLDLMIVLGIVSVNEAAKGKVPGLERTIPKSKGIEFTSVVHQLAAAFFKSPHKKEVRDMILSIASDANERFPKRGARKNTDTAEAPAPVSKPKTVAAQIEKKAAAEKKKPAQKAAPKAIQKAAKKKAPAKKEPKKKTAAAKAPAKKATRKAAPKKSAKKPAAKSAAKAKKKTADTKRLAKKKPR